MTWTVNETTTNQMADDWNISLALNISDNQDVLTVFGDSISASNNNFGVWFDIKNKGSSVFLYNAGVAGNTTTQMLSRIDDIPPETTICTVMEAVNDASQGVTIEQHSQNIKTILETLLQRGIRPILLMAPPSDTALNTEYINQVNFIDYITAKNLGVPIFDVWSQFVDVSSGGWDSGNTLDGTHPTPAVEKIAGDTLSEYWKDRNYCIPLSRHNGVGINDNSCFLTDTNADNIPDNWTSLAGYSSTQLIQTPLGLGNTWSMKWVDVVGLMYSDNFSVNSGDTYLFTMRVSTILNSGDTQFSVFLDSNGGDRYYMLNRVNVSVDETTISVIYTIPDGVSVSRIAIATSAGTYDIDINLAQAQYFNITDSTI